MASVVQADELPAVIPSALDDPFRINVEIMTETVRKAIDEQINFPDSLVSETIQIRLDDIAEHCKTVDEFTKLMGGRVALEMLLTMTFFSKECTVSCLISLVPKGEIINEPSGQFYIQYSGCDNLILHSFEAEDPFDDAPEDWIGPVRQGNPHYGNCFSFVEVSPLRNL